MSFVSDAQRRWWFANSGIAGGLSSTPACNVGVEKKLREKTGWNLPHAPFDPDPAFREGRSGGSITSANLSQSERDIAARFGLSDADYAAQLQMESEYYQMWKEQTRDYAAEFDSIAPPSYESSREG